MGQGEKDGPKEMWGELRQAQRTQRAPSPELPTRTAHKPTPKKPSRPCRFGGGCRHSVGALTVACLLPWNVPLPQETRPGCHLGRDRNYQGASPSLSLSSKAPSPTGQRKTVNNPLSSLRCQSPESYSRMCLKDIGRGPPKQHQRKPVYRVLKLGVWKQTSHSPGIWHFPMGQKTGFSLSPQLPAGTLLGRLLSDTRQHSLQTT